MAPRRRRKPEPPPQPVIPVREADITPAGKLPKRKFHTGKRPSAIERSLRIKQAAQLIGQGMDPFDAIDSLAERWGVRDPVTKRRYLDAVFARYHRQAKLNKEANYDTAIAVRREAMRVAILAEEVIEIDERDADGKLVLVDGKPVRTRKLRRKPDLDAYLRAADQIVKLQGLMQPESLEVVDAVLAPRIPLFLDVLRRYIGSDPIALSRATRDLRLLIEGGGKLKLEEIAAADVTVIEQPAAGPATTNGTHTNGKPPDADQP